MPATIPEKFSNLFDKRPFTSLVTLMPNGDPQVTPVWCDRDGRHVLVNSARGRQKDRNMARDPRVALSIAQNDDARADPYSIARVTLRGSATRLANDGAVFEALKRAWLARYPASEINFELVDFSFWAIQPHSARFVAGFGRIHNLSAQALAEAGA